MRILATNLYQAAYTHVSRTNPAMAFAVTVAATLGGMAVTWLRNRHATSQVEQMINAMGMKNITK